MALDKCRHHMQCNGSGLKVQKNARPQIGSTSLFFIRIGAGNLTGYLFPQFTIVNFLSNLLFEEFIWAWICIRSLTSIVHAEMYLRLSVVWACWARLVPNLWCVQGEGKPKKCYKRAYAGQISGLCSLGPWAWVPCGPTGISQQLMPFLLYSS